MRRSVAFRTDKIVRFNRDFYEDCPMKTVVFVSLDGKFTQHIQSNFLFDQAQKAGGKTEYYHPEYGFGWVSI